MRVVDASVIVKIAKEEEGTEEALKIKQEHVEGREKIIVPNLLFYEVANALRYAPELEEEDISNFLQILDDLDFEVIALDVKDIAKAVSWAKQKNITVYDAAYLALAREFEVELITADVALFDKVQDLGLVKKL